MRSLKTVRHLLREAGDSTGRKNLPDRAAARIAPEARVQMKRVLVLSALRTVLAGETNRRVDAVPSVAMSAVLVPSIGCAAKDTGVNTPVQRAAIPKAEIVPISIPAIPLLVVVTERASAKRMWARAIVASALAKVRALTHRGWLIALLRFLCLSPRLRLSCA